MAESEADWAMKYATERKARMKAEERVGSFMMNGPCLIEAIEKFIDAVFADENNAVALMTTLISVVKNKNDLSCDVNINIADPIWNVSDELRESILTDPCNVPQRLRNEIDEVVVSSAESVHNQWCELCEERGYISPERMDEKSRRYVMELLQNKAMACKKQRLTDL